MKLAVSLPLPPDAPRSIEITERAAGIGYEEAWLADGAGGADPFVLAGMLAARVPSLRVGIGVSPVYTRAPAVFAALAGALGQLMPGRFVLGLGASSETIVDRWNGVPFEKPLVRVRETVEVVRAMLSGERSSYRGRTVRSVGFRLLAVPPEPVPIYVGALKPAMLKVAGEVGDGVVVNLFPVSALPAMLEAVRAGAAKRSRDASRMEVVCRFQTCVTDRPEEARAFLRRGMAGYFTTSVYNAFAEWCGFEQEAREMREAWSRRDREATERAFSDEMIDAITLIGSAEHCRERMAAFAAAGVTTAVIHPFVPDPWPSIAALATRGPDVR